MEGTHLPLRTWFGAIYLAATSSKGVSAMMLSRQLDIGYKTAWFLAQRIRNLMTQDWETLKGLVEVDEVHLSVASAGRRTRPASGTAPRISPKGAAEVARRSRGGSRARRDGQGEAGALAR
jgi:hypothetical protein